MAEKRDLEVAVSYASEQRPYVERVVASLKAIGVVVFYDPHEKADMWGRDLTVYLDEVFRERARFALLFLSKEYEAKVWPRQELRSALARAVETQGPYLLPVRFDDTKLPGLLPTVVYVNAHDHKPEQIADLVLEKLGIAPAPAPPVGAGSAPVSAATVRLPRTVPVDFNPYAEAERMFASLQVRLTERSADLQSEGYVTHTSLREGRFRLRVLQRGETRFAVDVWIGSITSNEGNSLSFLHGHRESSSPGSLTATGRIIWDTERGLPVIDLMNMSLLRAMGGQYRLTEDELLDALWNAVIEGLEAR